MQPTERSLQRCVISKILTALYKHICMLQVTPLAKIEICLSARLLLFPVRKLLYVFLGYFRAKNNYSFFVAFCKKKCSRLGRRICILNFAFRSRSDTKHYHLRLLSVKNVFLNVITKIYKFSKHNDKILQLQSNSSYYGCIRFQKTTYLNKTFE